MYYIYFIESDNMQSNNPHMERLMKDFNKIFSSSGSQKEEKPKTNIPEKEKETK